MSSSRLLIAALVCTLAGTARAEPKLAEAKQLFEHATAAYTIGHFDEALAGYESAYGLYDSPAFLFNIAQCHFQLKQWDRAEFFFAGYLQKVPDAPNKALVTELMTEAHGHVEAEQQDLADDTADRELALARQREQEARVQAPAPVVVARASTAPKHRALYQHWWFWGAVGAVTAGVVTTIAITAGGGDAGDPGTESLMGSIGTWDAR